MHVVRIRRPRPWFPKGRCCLGRQRATAKNAFSCCSLLATPCVAVRQKPFALHPRIYAAGRMLVTLMVSVRLSRTPTNVTSLPTYFAACGCCSDCRCGQPQFVSFFRASRKLSFHGLYTATLSNSASSRPLLRAFSASHRINSRFKRS